MHVITGPKPKDFKVLITQLQQLRSYLSVSSSSSTTFPAKTDPFVHPDPETLSQLLHHRPGVSQLKQIHTQMITQACSSSPSLTHSLIHCYLYAKDLTTARTLFNSYPLPSPPTLLWNIMIRAYSKLYNCQEPIKLFVQMLALDRTLFIFPDEYTFTFVITSCSHQGSLVYGEIVHGMVVKSGFESNLYVGQCW
ncbi:mitochondrial editing factor 21 [Actinidia rufa]|uniref:Mitochondrial editing factor 21 n=1 Tax=Actinidia rufa TaxID=165716 RepID=A0A7J0DBL8_9ERIC|nr:mitochondrial editing factor 21 [Actinidia rufa]